MATEPVCESVALFWIPRRTPRGFEGSIRMATVQLIDWRSIEDEKEKYAAYLCSEEWGRLRRAVLKRADARCERCFSPYIESVHHLTYIRRYREDLADLQAVCQGCHDFIHGRSPIDPARCQRSVWYRELKQTTDWNRVRELLRKLTTG